MSDALPGYEGSLRDLLEKKGARVGCRVRIVREPNEIIEGILMPKHGLSDPKTIIIKLDNGYNIGVDVGTIRDLEVVECRELPRFTPPPVEYLHDKPTVMVIGTGGTIASRVEYETGAVRPAMTPEDLLDLIPELRGFVNLRTHVLFNILSENMTPRHWEKLANFVYKALTEDPSQGIVVAHGTDTMAYTAAALAFSLQKLPRPIVFVGAQRSSDRPSTDAALNFIAAVIASVKLSVGEVVVCMHGTTEDTYSLIHRGVKVRKMHSSRRDAFQSINDIPIAKVYPKEYRVEMITNRYLPPHRMEELQADIGFDDKVALVKAYPGFQAEIIDFLVDKGFHGIVIEGTGLGHIGEYAFKSIARAIEEGIPVVMTTQTLFGRVNMNVYTTGRKLLSMGVIPGEDMLPEVAFVKLSWILHKSRDLEMVKKLMLTNMVLEINPVHTVELYPRWFHG